ncbi:conserved exported hypothetical protein [Vibrio chagasii]|nr:conserved exported hypothetical protein [Vibrio chagasii]
MKYSKSLGMPVIAFLLMLFTAQAFSHGGAPPPPPPPPPPKPKPTVVNVSRSINEDSSVSFNPSVNGRGYGITGRRINRAPGNGSARWSGNNLIYKPNANWCGKNTFTYSVATVAGWSAVRTATISVACVVDKPWVGNSNGSIPEDTSVTLSPAMKLDGGTINGRYVTTVPSHGSVSWSGNKLVYKPSANYCGSDTFNYRIKTQAGYSNTAKGSISISCVIDKPILGDVSATFNEDTTKMLAPAINTDGAAIKGRYIKSAPLHGTATWSGDQLKYVPNANFCGEDTFKYQVKTSGGYSNTATASLKVSCVTDLPIISDTSGNLDEDTHKTLAPTINTDGVAITGFFVNQAPKNGSLVWSSSKLIYSPSPDYCGPDEFSYSIGTKVGRSNVATGKVSVKCIFDTPVVGNIVDNITEDTSKSFSPSIDTDGADVTYYGVVTPPVNGTANWNGGSIDYMPKPNFCGVDTFTYRISTVAGDSNLGKANINVACVDDLPTIQSTTVSVTEDSNKAISPSMWTDGLAITAHTVNRAPKHGTVKWSGERLIYTPASNYCGKDDFQYSIKTRAGQSNIAKSDITVNCVIDKPVIGNVNGNVNEDNALTLAPSINTDGAAIKSKLFVLTPKHGTATWSGSNLSYMPAKNYCGVDTFTYRITTVAGASNVATATVNIACVDDKPTVGSTNTTTNEDTVKTTSPTIWTDGLPITGRMIDRAPKHGTLKWNDNRLVYTPANNFCGTDDYLYSIKTRAGTSAVATGNVNVKCIVDKASIGNVTGNMDEDNVLSLSPSINTDGSAINRSTIVKRPDHGIATWKDGKLQYTPQHNYCGVDTFTYRITTSAGDSNTATATVNVACIDDLPTLGSVTVDGLEDTVKVIKPAIWTDGLTISNFTVDTAAKFGSVKWVGNDLVYTPNANYCGLDNFTYSIATRAGKSNVATGKVSVKCVVDTPIVWNVVGNLNEDTSVMLSPSINTDNASISASAISKQPANGHATWNGKQLKYTPKADFCGADSFNYHITTVAGQSNAGTANVMVNCIQDAPTLTGVETINISVGTTKTETYVASDADGETLTATLKLLNKASLPSWINFTFVNNQGKLTLTPSDTDMGDYELELKVTDTANGMKLKRIMVKVRDDRPITLTSILLKTFSKPQEFTSPSGRKMNSLYFTGIKDSTGKLITGTYTLTVTVDPNVNFPVTILGKTLQPGKPTPVSYTIPSPGVVDITAIPATAGVDGKVNFQISFDVL